MKTLAILGVWLAGLALCLAPPAYGPFPTGTGGGLSSNEVYSIALSVGGPTNGISASTATNIVNNNNAATATTATSANAVASAVTNAWRADVIALAYSNAIAKQEYFYTNTANILRSNQFTFSGGGMNGQVGYAPGASYANNEYILDLTHALQGNPEFLTATQLFHHISLFATNQLATGHTPAGVAQNGGLQTAAYSYHTDFSLIELAFLHFRKSGNPYIFTNFQANLSNALVYVQKSNNIPSSFGTNGNYWDGWGITEYGYNSYSSAHYKRCADLMAIMATSAGQPLVASNYVWQSAVIRASATNMFDETRGLMKTSSQGPAATSHSLVANALTVLYDAADDRIKNRIEEEFVKYAGHNNGFFQYGALRTHPVGECLDAGIDPDCDATDASGTYQTGGYWPLTWGVEVVARRNPDLAEAMMQDMKIFMAQTNMFYEWWNVRADLGITAINKGSSNYIGSAAIPGTYLLVGKMNDGEKKLLQTRTEIIANSITTSTLSVSGATTAGTLYSPSISGDGLGITNAVDVIAGDSSITIVTNANKRSFTLTSTASGGGGWTGNPAQFSIVNGQTNILDGGYVSNLVNWVDGFNSNRTLIADKDQEGLTYLSYDLDNSTLLFGRPPIANGQWITNINAANISGDLVVETLTVATQYVTGSITGNGSGLTNLSPAIATNNAVATDGMALVKRGNNLKLETISGSGNYIANTNGTGTNTVTYLNTDADHTLIQSTDGGPEFLMYSVGADTLVFNHAPIMNGSGITNINAANISGDLTLDSLTATTLNVDAINGNGAGITNSPYALFHETLANNVASRFIAPTAWTNVIFTTNSFNSDTAGAFTQSNSFLIVNAAGAGTWKVRGNVVIYNNSGNTGSVTPRLYRWTDSSTLVRGLTAYQYSYSAVDAAVVGVVTLTAGDILGLQVFAANTTTTTVGRQQNSGIDASSAYIEFERR